MDRSQCHFKTGDRVIITDGDFRGIEGRVARVARQQRDAARLDHVAPRFGVDRPGQRAAQFGRRVAARSDDAEVAVAMSRDMCVGHQVAVRQADGHVEFELS